MSRRDTERAPRQGDTSSSATRVAGRSYIKRRCVLRAPKVINTMRSDAREVFRAAAFREERRKDASPPSAKGSYW